MEAANTRGSCPECAKLRARAETDQQRISALEDRVLTLERDLSEAKQPQIRSWQFDALKVAGALALAVAILLHLGLLSPAARFGMLYKQMGITLPLPTRSLLAYLCGPVGWWILPCTGMVALYVLWARRTPVRAAIFLAFVAAGICLLLAAFLLGTGFPLLVLEEAQRTKGAGTP